jgi:hypothetical protein
LQSGGAAPLRTLTSAFRRLLAKIRGLRAG